VRSLIAAAALGAALIVASVPTSAGAATRPVTCWPAWVGGGKMGPGHSIKIRVKGWQGAWQGRRDLPNLPCRVLLADAKRIVRHGTWPDSMGGWRFDLFGPGYIRYYGGHGSWLQIYSLAEVGGSGDD
jgi:hypothetical protein